MASASMTTAPRSASSADTVDLPEPIPPVRPMSTTPGDGSPAPITRSRADGPFALPFRGRPRRVRFGRSNSVRTSRPGHAPPHGGSAEPPTTVEPTRPRRRWRTLARRAGPAPPDDPPERRGQPPRIRRPPAPRAGSATSRPVVADPSPPTPWPRSPRRSSSSAGAPPWCRCCWPAPTSATATSAWSWPRAAPARLHALPHDPAAAVPRRLRSLLRRARRGGASPCSLVVATGYWDSPLVFSLLTAVTVAGFARGFGFGLRIAARVASWPSRIPWALEPELRSRTTSARPSSGRSRCSSWPWSPATPAASPARPTSARLLALDRLGRLSDANALLYSAPPGHPDPAGLARPRRGARHHDGPAPGAVRASTPSPSSCSTTPTAAGTPLRREGTRPPTTIAHGRAPRAPRAGRCGSGSLVSEQNLLAGGGPGSRPAPRPASTPCCRPAGRSSASSSHRARATPHHFTDRDVELLAGFVEPAALAIDNARWFGRLRTVGADEERTRIARDLHDRIGQSLAYLAFELDRIVQDRRPAATTSTAARQPAQRRPRRDRRGPRHALRPAHRRHREPEPVRPRSRPSSTGCSERSGLESSHLRAQETGRLPLLQERELWRIAQEAVTNVERHAEATQVTITLALRRHRAPRSRSPTTASGFPVGKAGRLDSYGILGMRERAASIGATLDVDSEPGRGTRVRCTPRRPVS